MPLSLLQLDTNLLLWIHTTWRSQPADAFFLWITELRHFIWPAAILWCLLFLLGGRSGRWLAFGLALCLLATDQIAGQVLKPLFDRARPCFTVPGVKALVPVAHSPSFPSNHAANVFGLACLMAMDRGGYWLWGLPIAGLVGISRVYAGVHYPSDVLGGAVLGLMVAWIIWRGVIAMRIATESVHEKRRYAHDG